MTSGQSQLAKCGVACAVTAMLGASASVFADALADVQIVIGPEVCDGTPPAPKSLVIYAQNKNTTQGVAATLNYDTNPAGQSFMLYDANLAPLGNGFPWTHVVWIPPGGRARAGCTYTYRASLNPESFTAVPLMTTVSGASYVSPNPGPPKEDPLSFASFYIQGGFAACPSGALPAGLFMILNLHPYAHLVASVPMLDSTGHSAGVLNPDVPPLTTLRVGCSNGNLRPAPGTTVKLIYPANGGGTVKPTPPSNLSVHP